MPRIRLYYGKPINGEWGDNDPMDFCKKCWDDAVSQYENNPLAEITEDDHPPYDETGYKCKTCHKLLTEKDD